MKKLLLSLITILTIFGLAGCNENIDDTGTKEVALSKTECYETLSTINPLDNVQDAFSLELNGNMILGQYQQVSDSEKDELATAKYDVTAAYGYTAKECTDNEEHTKVKTGSYAEAALSLTENGDETKKSTICVKTYYYENNEYDYQNLGKEESYTKYSVKNPRYADNVAEGLELEGVDVETLNTVLNCVKEYIEPIGNKDGDNTVITFNITNENIDKYVLAFVAIDHALNTEESTEPEPTSLIESTESETDGDLQDQVKELINSITINKCQLIITMYKGELYSCKLHVDVVSKTETNGIVIDENCFHSIKLEAELQLLYDENVVLKTPVNELDKYTESEYTVE